MNNGKLRMKTKGCGAIRSKGSQNKLIELHGISDMRVGLMDALSLL